MKLFGKKEKKTVNKKFMLVCEILIALFLFGALLGIKWLITNKGEDSNVVKLSDQIVNDISFVDFKIVYEDDFGNVTLSTINYTENIVEFENLKIKLYAEDNSLVSVIDLAEKITLEKNQSHSISSKIATTKKIKSVEYIME